jgi:alpha-glucosidase (family GH31 glycosyl hydrolase)
MGIPKFAKLGQVTELQLVIMRHILSLYAVAFSLPSLSLTHAPTSPAPYSIVLKSGHNIVVNNSAILAGPTNSTASPVTASSSGAISNNGGKITYSKINPHVVKVQVNTNSYFVGARFSVFDDELFYGVWEYPWFDQITNTNVEFDLKGTGNSDGVNWSNARAPFFITNAGYGVYAHTLEMGSFDFTTPGQAQFIFNASTLVYYIILPSSSGNYKSIIEEYTALSSRIEMPPDSGYGPTFWSDDFEEDFHGSVSNAQDNYYDVVNHLYYNEIRATSMFADREELSPLSIRSVLTA